MNTTNSVKVETPSEFPYVVTKGNSTVKIYRVNSPKNKDGCYFQVCDLTGAKRKLISFAKFADARAEADRIIKLVKTGDIAALEMGSPERAEYGSAKARLAPTGLSLIGAADRCAESIEILGGDKMIEAARFFVARHPSSMPIMTVPELVKEMLEVKKTRGHAPRYLEDLKNRLKRFETSFTGKIVDIDTKHIQKWLDELGLSNQSYKNFKTVVHTLFSFAEKRGYIARGTNPVEIVETPKVKRGAVKVFTPSEFSALLNAAASDFLPALAIGGFAGLRSAEIQRLEWSNIDLRGRTISVPAAASKTNVRRSFKICAALAAWLEDFKSATGPVWSGNDDSLCDAQYRTAKAAQVEWKANALRHSYASYRLDETKNKNQVAEELGNSAAVVEKHYKAIVRPGTGKEWFAIFPAAPAE